MVGKGHYQQLLNKLVLSETATGDGAENFEQLGPILNSLHRSRREDAFLEHTTVFIQKKEQEIEQLCNQHYQVDFGFTIEINHSDDINFLYRNSSNRLTNC
jgi:hypothetical protein